MAHHSRDQSETADDQLLPVDFRERHDRDTEALRLKHDPRRRRYTGRHGPYLPHMRHWWFEVLGMFTSISALLAIFGILFAYNGKPISGWHAALRPNTIVAVLSTLSKSAMLMVVGQCIGQLKWVYFEQRPHCLRDIEVFDDASRGPLGSMKLLVHINWTALLASAGALITLLSLAMDPFVQQVISYDPVAYNDTSAMAFVSTAQAYDTGLSYNTFGKNHGGRLSSSISMRGSGDPSVTRAIYKGILGEVYAPTIDCASGNCTWPSYESLGICSTCLDVTPAARTNCSLVWMDGLGDEAPPLVWNRDCLTQSPGGVNIESYNYCEPSMGNTLWNASTLIAAPLPGRSHLLSKDGTIAIGSSFSLCNTEEESNVEDVVECTLKWCAKTYGGTAVQGGVLSNSPSKIDNLDFIQFETCNGLFNGTTAFRTKIFSDLINHAGTEEFRDIHPAFRQHEIPEYTCPALDADAAEEWADRDRVEVSRELAIKFQQSPDAFLINDRNTWDLQEAFHYIFRGGLTEGFTSAEDSFKFALSSAHQEGKFGELMDRVAESMTNSMRMAPNGTQIAGTVWRTEIRIIVRWQWMALPGAIVLFSTALLSVSIIFSHEKHRTIWKSSLLASLFHGLQGWKEDELDGLELKDMELRAKKMIASLKPGLDGSVKLVKHE